MNEGSPFAVFIVRGGEGQLVKLTLTPGTATLAQGTPATDGSQDFGPGLEYWNGSAWTVYVPGTYVAMPEGATTLLVRTPVVNDTPEEGDHAFTLTAAGTGAGARATATGTINDRGEGSYFAADNTTGVSAVPPGVFLDDDRFKGQLPPPTFRAEPASIYSPLDNPMEPNPYRWEVIPLGPPPALVTGTVLAGQQGNAQGFSTTPGGNTPHPDLNLGGFNPFARQEFGGTSGERPGPLPSPLLEGGRPGAPGSGPLYVARDPGGADVRNVESTTLTLPRGVFGHVDRNARVTVEVRLADGSLLPSWIRVSADSGRVIITPPSGFTGVVELRLIARDNAGNTATTSYTIVVREQQAALQLPAADGPPPQSAEGQGVLAQAREILALFAGTATDPLSVAADASPVQASGRAGLSHMLALAALEREHTSLTTTGATSGS